jgi:hypothetical protein
MIVFSLLLLASLLAGMALFRVARGRAREIHAAQEFPARVTPVDLEAFLNLLDPEDDAFLSGALPAQSYEILRRMRIRAAIAYLECAADNAAVIIRLAQSLAPAPALSQPLVNDALRLRLLCKLAICRLHWEFFFPAAWGRMVLLAEDYRALSGRAADLVRSREPALAHRVLAALQA